MNINKIECTEINDYKHMLKEGKFIDLAFVYLLVIKTKAATRMQATKVSANFLSCKLFKPDSLQYFYLK